MRSRLVWIGLLVVVCSGLLAAGATADNHTQYQLQADQPEPDNTVTRIALQPNGDAIWTIRFRTRLATADEVDDYETFQDGFAANTSRYLDPFADRMTGVVDGATDQYDREMRAVDFEASTTIQEVPRRWGVVSFQFRWEGFAAETGNELAVGDVFAGGFYIGEGDVLEIAAPDGYQITEVDPTPAEAESGVVQWNGREDFADGRPQLIVTPDAGSTSTDGGMFFGGIVSVIIGGIGLAVVISLGVLAIRRRQSDSDPGERSDWQSAVSKPASPTDSGSDNSTDNSTDTGTNNGTNSSQPAHEFVTNETQVLDLLEQHNGQLKQADIVESLDWSKSKTSRVLSELAEEGVVEKIRLGRENVIRLPNEA
jgi:hypothetical protein